MGYFIGGIRMTLNFEVVEWADPDVPIRGSTLRNRGQRSHGSSKNADQTLLWLERLVTRLGVTPSPRTCDGQTQVLEFFHLQTRRLPKTLHTEHALRFPPSSTLKIQQYQQSISPL